MEILEKLFGGAAKVKIMRLFLFNPHTAFDTATIAERTQISAAQARREVNIFSKMGFIKKKSVFKDTKKKGASGYLKRKVSGWSLSEQFPYLRELHAFLVNPVPLKNGSILRKLSRAGKLKLVIVAGLFINNPDSRVDLLVVGDHLKKNALKNAIKFVESEVGKELRYAAFTTDDFRYRLSVYDKLLRDIIDFPHEKVLDKLGS